MSDPTPPLPQPLTSALPPYDAVVLVSFGGPERPQDVLPFLQNVTAGRGIPPERLDEVAGHYLARGGRSPINDQNRALIAALAAEADRRGLDVPILWGNRNWSPYLVDTLRDAVDAGHRRVLAILTSAFSSYSSCRQYREDVGSVLLELAAEGRTLEVDKVRPYFNHPAFAEVMTEATLAALDRLPAAARDQARLLFVTHSIPDAMNDASGPPQQPGSYLRQHEALAAQVMASLGSPARPYDLVFCSRSGPPAQPWLEPDINDHLRALAAGGLAGPEAGVVVVPIGFVSDHMEVVFDLDDEAATTARTAGIPFARAATVGTDPRFVSALLDLAAERAAQARGDGPPRPVTGELGPLPAVCPAGCCRNLRADRPAACGADWTPPAADAQATTVVR